MFRLGYAPVVIVQMPLAVTVFIGAGSLHLAADEQMAVVGKQIVIGSFHTHYIQIRRKFLESADRMLKVHTVGGDKHIFLDFGKASFEFVEKVNSFAIEISFSPSVRARVL